MAERGPRVGARSTTVYFWHPVAVGEAVAIKRPSHITGPSWMFQNPELSQLVEELRKEKDRLAEKEKQLNELAVRLNSERQELNQVTQAIHGLQMEFDRSVTRIEEGESANLKKLARMYASMAPENAVLILNRWRKWPWSRFSP